MVLRLVLAAIVTPFYRLAAERLVHAHRQRQLLGKRQPAPVVDAGMIGNQLLL
ncbi:hypothetical protein [Enterobacter asburiae]|uniref:hypothetical protein n=1 Tax=Enterobacter asburiae TaxID=61645 RepID=UPI001576490A|nr:hypothetical protein [Enterobacter asburiae]